MNGFYIVGKQVKPMPVMSKEKIARSKAEIDKYIKNR